MRRPWKIPTALLLTALLAPIVTPPVARAAEGGTGWLGISMQSLSAELRDGLGYDGDGVLVAGVESDGPADRAGVRKGDVIVSFNSRAVTGTSMLSDLVANSAPGKSVSLGLWRHGTRQTLSARLGARPADAGSRMRSESGDDTWELPAPSAPKAPRAPMPPEAPKMMWMDRDLHGMPELRRSLREMSLPGMGRGRLGVSVQELDSQLGEYFGAPAGKGVLVSGVTDDTPASRAGFKAGDVIVKVGDREVEDSGELREALRARPAGKVDVVVLRKGQRVTLSPVLEEPVHEGSFRIDGNEWKQTGPGEWRFEGPNGEKRIMIHRSGDDDGDGDVRIEGDGGKRIVIRKGPGDGDHEVHIEGDGGRRIVIHRDSGDDDETRASDERDRAEMQRRIDQLEKQVEELRQQLATPAPKPAPAPAPKKKSTK